MEKMDHALAQRVWQRVWGESEGIGPQLNAEEEATGIYRLLLQRLPQKGKALRQLLEETEFHRDCLRGIAYLTTGTHPTVTVGKPRQETTLGLLRRGYGQCIKMSAEYAKRNQEPEYGPVFEQLAANKRRHAMELLQILGTLSPQK